MHPDLSAGRPIRTQLGFYPTSETTGNAYAFVVHRENVAKRACGDDARLSSNYERVRRPELFRGLGARSSITLQATTGTASTSACVLTDARNCGSRCPRIVR